MFFDRLFTLVSLKSRLMNSSSFSQLYSKERLPLHSFRKEGAMLTPLIAGLLAACGGGGGGGVVPISRPTPTGDDNATPTAEAPIVAQAATQGEAYSFQIAADAFDDADADDVLTWSATGLPAGLSFNAATRTISGTPTNGDVGIFNVTITVTDTAGARASQSFQLTIANVNDAPTLVGSELEYTIVQGDTALSSAVTAQFADIDVGDELTFSGASADGSITVNADGSIDASAAEAGRYEVEVTATDEAGASVTATFIINVQRSDFTIQVADGPVLGAHIYIDADNDGQRDDNEAILGTTDVNGEVTIAGIHAGKTLAVDMSNAFDTYTGQAFDGTAATDDDIVIAVLEDYEVDLTVGDFDLTLDVV